MSRSEEGKEKAATVETAAKLLVFAEHARPLAQPAAAAGAGERRQLTERFAALAGPLAQRGGLSPAGWLLLAENEFAKGNEAKGLADLQAGLCRAKNLPGPRRRSWFRCTCWQPSG